MLDIANKEDYLNGSVHKNLIIELEDGSTISNKNILKESMAINEILMEDNQLRFGRCNASEFSITLATVASNIKNEKIKVYIESNDSRLQLGEFTVNFVEKSADKSFKQITALDNMQNIDKDVTEWYKTLSFPMTQKAFRDSFFSYVGLEQVDVALPFDNLIVNDPFGNMVSINGRIIAEGICELNARFGHCNREGKFEYIQLNSSGNEILDINKKYINCSYDDFVTQTIDRVIIIDEYGTQVSNNNNGNNAYVINNNFMLYGRTVDELRTLGNQFLELVKDVEYTPFTMENRGLPYVQLGDSIHATTNNGEFNSFIFRRALRGIQALRDIYSAEGEEYLISDLNSIQQKIDEANRNTERTRIELTTSIEGLKSTVTSVETIANNANTVANQANTKADEALDNVNISSTSTGKYITVEDSGSYPLIELYGYGKSEQKSYTGKNLLENTATSQTYQGIVFVVNSDGSIKATGTTTSADAMILVGSAELEAGTYIASMGEYTTNGGYKLRISKDDKQTLIGHSVANQGLSFTLTENTVVYAQVRVQVEVGTVIDCIYYPMIRKATITDSTYEKFVGGEASPNPLFPQAIESVADDGNLVVNTNNNNLLDVTIKPSTYYGINVQVNDDKSITVNGTTAQDVYLVLASNITLEKGKYMLSGGISQNQRFQFAVDGVYYNDKGQGAVLDFDKATTIDKFYLVLGTGQTVNNLTFYPMIRKASIDDDSYEPYKATQATIPLTDSLRGIKVTEGGNYTDETGQQWVCDTLEKYADGSGKLVQRVYHKVFDGSETWNEFTNTNGLFYQYYTNASNCKSALNLMCSHFTPIPISDRTKKTGVIQYDDSVIRFAFQPSLGFDSISKWKEWLASNNVSVLYELAEPIETPLTAEQIAEIEKLQTYNNITHVTTDDIGDIAIQYYKNNANADVVAQGNQNVLAKAQSSITQTADEIKLEVSKTYSTKNETTEIDNRLKEAESSITQNANNIELKVSKDEVVSSINQSPEEIKIQANKLKLEGYTSINNGLQVLEDGSVLITKGRLVIYTPNDKDSTITLNRVLYDGDEVIMQLLPQYIQFERYETDGSSRVGTLGSVSLFLKNTKPSGTNEIDDGLDIDALDKEIRCITYNRDANGDVLSETVHYQINDNLAFFRPSVRTEGELQTTSKYAFRSVYGDYGFMIFNPGDATYFLLTNSGDQYGGFNSLRPFAINNSTGYVTMANGLTVAGGFTSSNSATFKVNLTVDGTATVGGDSWLKGGLRLGNSNATVIKFIRCGTTVVNLSGTSVVLLSLSTIQSWYSGAGATNTAILVSNGDAGANGTHIESASYQSNNWYVVVNGDTKQTGSLRINYTVICW